MGHTKIQVKQKRSEGSSKGLFPILLMELHLASTFLSKESYYIFTSTFLSKESYYIFMQSPLCTKSLCSRYSSKSRLFGIWKSIIYRHSVI
jgi:hypothetical protein